jgi:uncharacterized membrane protein
MIKWVIRIALLCALCGAVAAQGTGGSMGGGSWGGGGGGGGGGYSSSSSSSSSSDYSYSSGNYSSSGGSGDLGVDVVFLVLGFLVWAVITVAKGSSVNTDNVYDDGSNYTPPAGDSVDVTVLRVAVDGRARKFVQSELARIAKLADTSTPEGRVTMLREVALTLRRLRDAWVYGGAVNEPMRAMTWQKEVFDRYCNDARARFREETVRNEQGVKTATPASAYTPHTEEGAGLILVSIIIAARRELFTVNEIGSGNDLRAAIEAAGTLDTNSLVAVEIVWQPSEDNDRMSSMELEAKYPKPDLIPLQNALVGKVFCTYCGGPYPAELVSCPHCGAPAAGRTA